MHRFKITIKQQFLVLLHFLSSTAILIFIQFFYFNFDFTSKFVIVSLLFLFSLPVIVLHFQYLRYNIDTIFTINSQKNTFSYITGKEELTYSFKEIIAIYYYESYGRKTGVYSFALYRYYKIVLADKKELIISCLLINDIENTLEILLKTKAEKRFKFICFI